jgi:fatty acid CoA ligase FadD9
MTPQSSRLELLRATSCVLNITRAFTLSLKLIPHDPCLQAFSRANSLLTDSNKPARSRLRTLYGPRLEALYDELEKRREERLQNARAAGANGHLSIAERVRAALEMTLGVEAPLSGDATFRQMGGDSLASVRFVGLLKEMTGADISVAVVLDPSMDMGRLARLVEGTQREEEEEDRVYKAVHGDRVEREGKLRASDLQLEKFIPPQELEALLASGQENGTGQGQAGKVVFLTGATGFLGRNLLLDLLTHVARSEKGKVVCLVREAGDVAARRRLLEESIGPVETSELRRKLQPMEQRLEVLAGTPFFWIFYKPSTEKIPHHN